ncbi:Scr1 family TA system antitoxin-like transcriptional regulator [Nocardia sp. CA-119907]
MFPGLLQTPAYASSVIRAAHPEDSVDEHARRAEWTTFTRAAPLRLIQSR